MVYLIVALKKLLKNATLSQMKSGLTPRVNGKLYVLWRAVDSEGWARCFPTYTPCLKAALATEIVLKKNLFIEQDGRSIQVFPCPVNQVFKGSSNHIIEGEWHDNDTKLNLANHEVYRVLNRKLDERRLFF